MNVNDIPVEETTQQKTEVDYLSAARQARSMQNWPSVEQNYNMLLNCFDILHANKVFLAKEVVEKIEEVLA